MNMKHLNTRGGDYETPTIEILAVTAERGFAGSGTDVPDFNDPDILTWEYGDPTNQ